MCNAPSLRFLRQASFDFAQDRQDKQAGFRVFLPFACPERSRRVSGRISEEGMRVG